MFLTINQIQDLFFFKEKHLKTWKTLKEKFAVVSLQTKQLAIVMKVVQN